VTHGGPVPRRTEDGGIELAKEAPVLYVFPVIAGAIGGVAMVAGEVDDAPGLVLMGLVLVVGAIAHARKLRR
jgi:hypothetical protein